MVLPSNRIVLFWRPRPCINPECGGVPVATAGSQSGSYPRSTSAHSSRTRCSSNHVLWWDKLQYIKLNAVYLCQKHDTYFISWGSLSQKHVRQHDTLKVNFEYHKLKIKKKRNTVSCSGCVLLKLCTHCLNSFTQIIR